MFKSKKELRRAVGMFIWEAVGVLTVTYMYLCVLFGIFVDTIRWIKRL